MYTVSSRGKFGQRCAKFQISIMCVPYQIYCKISSFLKLKEMREIVLAKRESGLKVLLSGLNLLNVGEKSLVKSSLIGLSLLGKLADGRVFGEELLLGELLLSCLLLLEVSIIELLGVHTREVDLGGRCNDISLVDTADGYTVDGEGTSDKKKTRGKLLKEDNSLSLETAGEEDKHSAGGDGGLSNNITVHHNNKN